jgi:hypothetical protein
MASVNTLNRSPNIPDPDGFYEELISAQRDLSDEQADMLLSKLVLILANEVGDRGMLREALALACTSTMASSAVPSRK